jgi:hypothetical protein
MPKTLKAFLPEATPKKRYQIARGMNVSPKGDDEIMSFELAQKFLDGKATVDDILKMVDTKDVGAFWYPLGFEGASIEDAKEFADGEELIAVTLPRDKKGHQQRLEYAKENPDKFTWSEKDAGTYAEVPIVLVGIGPEGWSPDDNESNGLMGNSYIDMNYVVPLTQIHYKVEPGKWRMMNATGKTVRIRKPR